MMKKNNEFKPKIVAFVCNYCTYAGADLAGMSRLKYSSNVKIIRHTCSSRINPLFIIKALEKADGVIVSGCHPGDCHFNNANLYARRRWIIYRDLLSFLGVDMRRIIFSFVSAAEGKKWADLVNETSDKIKELGPLSFL